MIQSLDEMIVGTRDRSELLPNDTPIKFTIQTQTESSDVISVCHVNENLKSLSISPIARTMFVKNRTLFNKINLTTKMIGGVIYREEIIEPLSSVNKCGVKLFSDYRYKDKQIIDLSFKNNSLIRSQSILTKTNKKISFDPDSLIPDYTNQGTLDPQNLTFSDVESSTMICDVKEILLFQNIGVRTYILTDFMGDSPGLESVSYRISLKATTEFEDYLTFILNEIRQSINFLTSYSNSVSAINNYDADKLEFKKSFSEPILTGLGLVGDDTYFDLGSERIKNSNFGKVALNFYNGMLLLKENVDKKIYGKIMLGILPTSKTNPDNILQVLKSLSSLYTTIQIEYGFGNKLKKPNDSTSKITYDKINLQDFVSKKTERFDISNSVLGYNIFSEKQKGLNNLSISSYGRRIQAERAKYYPSLKISDQTKFLTRAERNSFTSNKNNASFVTPVSLRMGGKSITTSRGMKNIPINMIKAFRLAKSSMASQIAVSSLNTSNSSTMASETLSRFNIEIKRSHTPINQRPAEQEVESLIDAKRFLGENSFFVTDTPELVQQEEPIFDDIEITEMASVISEGISNMFLNQNGIVGSLEELNLSNSNSVIRNLVAENNIDFDDIPPQIKSMMTEHYQDSNVDPLKNSEARALMFETLANIFLVQAHTGFKLDRNGFADLNQPIIQNMGDVDLKNQRLLATAKSYEMPQLGILKDTFVPTIYNNLLYIGGR